MELLKNTVELSRYPADEVPTEYHQLIARAREALSGSYSPYSHFAVGAAVELQNGEIIIGSNQENAAYPSGLCAERTALFYTGAAHPNELIKSIAVVVETPIAQFPFPCGSCLQVISEYEDKQGQPVDILMIHPKTGEILLSRGIQNLLPHSFKKSHLRK